jgi:hypothetical protein
MTNFKVTIKDQETSEFISMEVDLKKPWSKVDSGLVLTEEMLANVITVLTNDRLCEVRMSNQTMRNLVLRTGKGKKGH